MKFFTQEEVKPSEQTLHIIRQIAYNYRIAHVNGRETVCCLN